MRSGLGGGRQSSEFRVYSSAGGSRQGVWGDRWQPPAACAGKARLKAWGAQRARAERTGNMEPMFVTLEVSKLLSGWLNLAARCAESKGGHKNAMRSEVRTGRREGLG
jgi:hypothetical protein